MLAGIATHPFTYRYQQQRPGCDWLPDAVTDTTRKRQRGARRLFGHGAGIICRLLACSSEGVTHAVLLLPDDYDFYTEAPEVARQLVRDLLQDRPYYAKLALSRELKPHLHILTVQDDWIDQLCRQQVIYGSPVKSDQHLQAVAEYFSRPSDERACRPRPKEFARYEREDLALQVVDASELYLRARAQAVGGHLPRRSWTGNLPFLKATTELAVSHTSAMALHLLTLSMVALCLVLQGALPVLGVPNLYEASAARCVRPRQGSVGRVGLLVAGWPRAPP